MREAEAILDGELAARAERALANLWPGFEDPIELGDHSWMDPEWLAAAFAEGLAGPAIALAHRAIAGGDEAIADRSRALLVAAVEAGGALWRAPGLIQGLAGLGYTVEHFAATGLVEDIGEVAEPIAARVCDYLSRAGLTFDLFFGSAGMIVYGVERIAGSRSSDVLDAALARLERQATREGGQVTWVSVADTRWLDPEKAARYPNGHINTSMSHGVAGALGALGAAIRAGAGERAEALAAPGLAWVWDAGAEGGDRRWPNIIGERGGGAGWCRGDLGVAAGAWAAASALGDLDLAERAAAAAGAALDRSDYKSESINLCHGPAGAAHISARFWQRTGDPAFAARTRRVTAELLDALARLESGPGLLHGTSGAALVLLSLLGHIEPTWDRWFLPGL